jgi:hypothetical protein
VIETVCDVCCCQSEIKDYRLQIPNLKSREQEQDLWLVWQIRRDCTNYCIIIFHTWSTSFCLCLMLGDGGNLFLC